MLRAVAANAARITALTAEVDRETFAAPAEAGVSFRLAALPEPVEILVGDVEKRPNPRSGREMLVMSPQAVPVRMKDYGVFEVERTRRVPAGWLIPKPHAESGRYAAALERLRWHGVRVRTVAADTQVDVERFVVRDLTRAERAFQGHREARLTGSYEVAKLSAQQGALFVPANQPLGRLAFYLLEPESDDGLVTWNLIDEGLVAGATYPIYRVTVGGALQFRD